MSSPPGADAPAHNPPLSRIWWFVGPMSVLLTAVLAVMLIRPVPYVIFTPGSAKPVPDLIQIGAADGEPAPMLDEVDDDIFFLTVTVSYPNGFYLLTKLRDDHADVAPSRLYLGTQSAEENRQFNQALMTSSKDRALKVALETAGYEVDVTESGAIINDIGPDYPAASVLVPGDVIVSADGAPVSTAEDLSSAIAAHAPGERIALELIRLGEGEARTVTAELAANPEDESKAQLGVIIETRVTFGFPVVVEIDSGEVGGPSAGLAFTLALIDRLTGGDLTGDLKVATTGTMELDGTVGDVGGVRQKTKAAIDGGADLLLVPPGELDEAVEAAGDSIEVVAVANVEEALAALQDRGGDPVGLLPRSS